MSLPYRFLRLQLIDGNVETFIGPLIVDTSRFPNGNGVQGMLGALSQWIANAPDPLPISAPAPRTPTLDERVSALEPKVSQPGAPAPPVLAGSAATLQ